MKAIEKYWTLYADVEDKLKMVYGWYPFTLYEPYQGKKIVLVTHGPPNGTKLDLLDGKHVGNIDYSKFIERIKPKLVICGHLHENVGAMDKKGKTQMVHPGWDGMVIELP